MSCIKAVGFDADDTLWVNMPFFTATEERFSALLSPYADPETISRELYQTETANMAVYGFGTKSFTLSMIETALRLGGTTIGSDAVQEIIGLGKALLNHPLQVLDGVEEVLATMRRGLRLVVATKGDLLEQERKLERSDLQRYFHHIEIMSDKTEKGYAKLLAHLEVEPEEFLMVGNSVKSDILPVLALGGYAVHVPFHDTWVHEQAPPPDGRDRFFGVNSIRELPELPVVAAALQRAEAG